MRARLKKPLKKSDSRVFVPSAKPARDKKQRLFGTTKVVR